MKYLLLLLGLCVFLAGGIANAAIKSSQTKEEARPEDAYNPRVDKEDLELPMPNGLKLVLRAVAVPAKNGPLDDTGVWMGIFDPEPGRIMYEKQVLRHLSAPFRQDNLPADWRKKMDKQEADQFLYYFLGKYELSNGQWDAVMGGKSGERAELPKTNISWYDIQDFLRKYNEWLMANHPDKIPAIDGVPGFLRLPTEAEWEYAAKGGSKVPETEQQNKDVMEEKLEDYAVFGNRYKNIMPIGSKLPNNLGFYDLAGNAAELVGDGFRFTVSEQGEGDKRVPRLHGAEGGLISKGGNYLAKEKKELYPGRRVETRMFVKNNEGVFEPLHDRALGTRLVLSSLNVPGQQRARALEKQGDRSTFGDKPEKAQAEVKKPSGPAQGEKVDIDIHGDPMLELEKIYVVAQSPDMKSNLDQYKLLIQDVNDALARERDDNLLSSVRAVAYMADSLSNIAFRCFEIDNRIKGLRGTPGFTKEIEKKFQDQVKVQYDNLKRSTNIYRSGARALAKVGKKDLDAKILQLTKQYEGKDRLNVNFRDNLKAVAEHIEIINKKGPGALTDMNIWERVIPGDKSVALLKQLQKSEKKH